MHMFDKRTGELIGDLGANYRVVDNVKWRDSQLFEVAASRAAKAFWQSGALLPITFDDEEVLTQEYPHTGKLVMLFGKVIRGQKHFYPYIWEFTDAQVAELTALGKWAPLTEH